MPDITPIPTRYAGCFFRSRLEARWAVFFDSLNIAWEYEPEAFSLPSGNYLPDFRLTLGADRHKSWFEVKPDNHKGDDQRWFDLCTASGMYLFAAFGIPRPNQDFLWSERGNGWIEMFCHEGWDNFYSFAVCLTCNAIDLVFEGRSERICLNCYGNDAHKVRTHDNPIFLSAYTAAHSARFEDWRAGNAR